MILAVDVGNTNIVMGCMEEKEIKSISRLATNAIKTEYEYAVEMKQILDFNGIDTAEFEGAVISSVVPPITNTLAAAIKMITGLDSIIVGAGIKTGVNIAIDNPAQLGSDLLVAAVAALAAYKPPLILLDMGTATTFTAIDENAKIRGGAIVPGVGLSLNALVSGTSQLPKISIEAPKHCIGSNTIDSMKSGCVFATASMIDGMIDRMSEELNGEVTVIATGGLSNKIVPYCKRKIIHDDDLILAGLAIIYSKNKRK